MSDIRPMKIVICGLSITSSWGNGHATTYRALTRALSQRGHEILFLERNQPWYAENRDLPNPSFIKLGLYGSVEELKDRFSGDIRDADAVIVGSYVPEGIRIGEWVIATTRGLPAFYDIDTPVTIEGLKEGKGEYLNRDLIQRYGLYLSFTGGPILRRIEQTYGSPKARALYCSADTSEYFPVETPKRWDLGYLGTYSSDRQPKLEELLLRPASARPGMRFVVAGAQYPDSVRWTGNTHHLTHLSPHEHRAFYNSQRFTLNLTRHEMVEAGFSPSVRLFEAAACGTPIISDRWSGLNDLFEIGKEILVAETANEILECLEALSDQQGSEIGRRGRERVLQEHTSAHRAAELECLISETLNEIAGHRSARWKVACNDQ